jgi:hypothetical protein
MRVKARVAQMVVREAVVAVINTLQAIKSVFAYAQVTFIRALALFFSGIMFASATVLPDERVDVLGHMYDGGGIQVSGPSMLIRKNIGSAVSVSAHYYIDVVSSASIDVQYSKSAADLLSGASKYSEDRTEKNIGAEYIHDRTTFSLGYTTSEENDYNAKTYNFGVSQAFFGDLTTLSFGLGFGLDLVGKNLNGNPDPAYRLLEKDRRKYTFGISQILTKNLIVDLSVDAGSDHCTNALENDSCLNNPQRQVRFTSNSTKKFDWQSEIYPLTHNTDAIGLRAIYHLPYRASIRGDLRSFSDSWGVKASNAELRYTQEVYKDVLVEVKYRVYSQTQADFYNDLFPYKNAQTFLARDKELSQFSSKSVGLGVTYKLPWALPGIEKSTANFYWDHMKIDYDNFHDFNNFMGLSGFEEGDENLYSLDADVIRLYVSFWF